MTIYPKSFFPYNFTSSKPPMKTNSMVAESDTLIETLVTKPPVLYMPIKQEILIYCLQSF